MGFRFCTGGTRILLITHYWWITREVSTQLCMSINIFTNQAVIRGKSRLRYGFGSAALIRGVVNIIARGSWRFTFVPFTLFDAAFFLGLCSGTFKARARGITILRSIVWGLITVPLVVSFLCKACCAGTPISQDLRHFRADIGSRAKSA